MSWVDVGGLTPGATIPKDLDDYLPIRSVPQRKSRFGFSKVIANGVDSDFGNVFFLGNGQTVATYSVLSLRAQAFQDLADGTIPMVLQLRVPNGNAPASGTTWTLAFIDYEQYAPQQVSLVSARPMNPTPQYVAVQGTPSVYTFYTASVGTMYSLTTTASTNAANIRNAKAVLGEVTISNVTATACYVKFYNKSSSPTVDTDIPVLTIPVPANTTVNMAFGLGKAFSTGLSIAVTAGAAATDTANAVAGVQISATYA